MDIQIYLKCFAVALIGWIIQTALKMKALETKAKAANVPFKFSDYFKEDKFSVLVSLATIVMFLFVLDELFRISPKVMDYIKVVFAFVGYTSSDIASRLFSVINKRLNDTIDRKTNIADSKIL